MDAVHRVVMRPAIADAQAVGCQRVEAVHRIAVEFAAVDIMRRQRRVARPIGQARPVAAAGGVAEDAARDDGFGAARLHVNPECQAADGGVRIENDAVDDHRRGRQADPGRRRRGAEL